MRGQFVQAAKVIFFFTPDQKPALHHSDTEKRCHFSLFQLVAKLLKSTNEMFSIETGPLKETRQMLCASPSPICTVGGPCCPYIFKLQATVSKLRASPLLYICAYIHTDPVAAVKLQN